MLITITIRLKDGVLDPEGRAIESALKNLGYTEASAISGWAHHYAGYQ